MRTYFRQRARRTILIGALSACLGILGAGLASAQKAEEEQMSSMGKLAQRAAQASSTTGGILKAMGSGDVKGGGEGTLQDDEAPHVIGGQAETSVAVDSTGQHLVAGFNDTRGFSLNPVSVSGYMYSDDGGLTWIDGGQLPVNTGTTTLSGQVYPQVFGDPEIVYMGGSTFIYASIAVKTIFNTTAGVTSTAQTMCIHTSTDYGHTWKGPYIIDPATNPHGLFNNTATNKTARDTADKEFLHRDPDTGRVMMSWSNFTSTAFAAGGVEIKTTYSDDILSAIAANTAPTWSPGVVVAATANDGQSSLPRFAGNGSNMAYVLWRRSGSFGFGNEAVAISSDNGQTWGAPINLRGSYFKTMDQVLGNDRINNSPSMDVNHATGDVYAVYAENNSNDGADIAFQRSTTNGATWTSPLYVNSRPGNDRAQWFPWINVDQSTGRIHVFYYDQGIDTSGDLTEVSHTYSDDGGNTWSAPAPLSDRPYHAGFGNDTGQPNIGDYNQGVSRLGEFMATFAYTPNQIHFQDGQPSGGMSWPDIGFARKSTFNAGLRLGAVSVADSSGDGIYDPGETLTLGIPLESYANNAPVYTGVSAVLSTTTPNVTVTQGNSAYADVATLASSTNTTPFTVKLGSGFVPGTWVELKLDVTTALGNTSLLYTLKTGKPQDTVLYNDNFETGTGSFTTAHGGGTNTVPWVRTNAQFLAAPFNTSGFVWFHQNENDAANPTRWERLVGPILTVPAGSDYVQVDFDVAFNSEDEPTYNIYAWDGFFLRVTDQTGGSFIARSVLAEAFAQDFTTGNIKGYPKHLPRNSSASYFEDMACWSGYSNGWKHVSMKLPGTGGTKIQLRFEYAQDAGGTGHDTHGSYPTSGVAMDNLVVKAVKLIADANAAPIANAGADQTVECAGDHNYVNLDAGLSSDADGEPITYEWFQGTTSLGVGPTITVDAPKDTTTTYKVVVTDAHSNSSSDTVDVTVADTTPPVVTLNGLATVKIYYGDSFVDPGATASDICDGDLTSSIQVTGSVNSLAIGSYTLTYTATDDATNSASKQRVVKVIYPWSDLLQPVNTDNSSIFKLGSTIPLKFTLSGAASNLVITAKVYLAKVSNNVVGSEIESTSTSAADSGNTFRLSNGQYIYNLSTKGLSTGTWQIRIDLGDGELHTVLISLK